MSKAQSIALVPRLGQAVGSRPLREVAQAATAHIPPGITLGQAVVFGAAIVDALSGVRGQPLTRIAAALLMPAEEAAKVRETCDRIAEQQRAELPATESARKLTS